MEEVLSDESSAVLSVSIDLLYDGATVTKREEELQMIVRQGDVAQSISKVSPLDLPQVDFVGPADVVKRLFTLPYDDGQPLFAFHRVGNTLLLDTVTAQDISPTGAVHPNAASTGGGSAAAGVNGSVGSIGGSHVLPALTLGLHEVQTTISSDVTFYQPSRTSSPAAAGGGRVSETAIDAKIDAFDEGAAEGAAEFGSPYVPPPDYFIPNVPSPSKQVLSWDLHEMRLALGSDLPIYHTEEHPAFLVKVRAWLAATHEMHPVQPPP